MISVVMTCLNARKGVESFTESIKLQSVKPDEIVVLDGGSTDGTVELLRKELPEALVMVDQCCNIVFSDSPVSVGRNRAIEKARGDIILVTDAGCYLDRDWVKELSEPFKDPAVSVVGGRYVARIRSRRDLLFSMVLTSHGGEKEPSSRSIAFRKRIWEIVGGYPEVALTADDTSFNEKIKDFKYIYNPKAVVSWEMPDSWYKFLRQIYRYSKGDGICRLRIPFYLTKTVKIALILLAVILLVDTVRVYGFFVGLIKEKW